MLCRWYHHAVVSETGGRFPSQEGAMPRPRDAVPFVFALALIVNAAAAWAGEAKAVKIERTWRGEFSNRGQAALAPKSYAITTAKEWQKLWKGWRGDAKLPKI